MHSLICRCVREREGERERERESLCTEGLGVRCTPQHRAFVCRVCWYPGTVHAHNCVPGLYNCVPGLYNCVPGLLVSRHSACAFRRSSAAPERIDSHGKQDGREQGVGGGQAGWRRWTGGRRETRGTRQHLAPIANEVAMFKGG
jgi:hypothetical protein